MEKRKSLPKKVRYEVLKRDSFTCQYCGRMAPEVILEVDHIIPVAEGGDEEMFNLITSCRDCNRGKGKTTISDQTVIEKQKKQLKDANEVREQVEMMIKWREELKNTMDMQIDEICNLVAGMTKENVNITDKGRSEIRRLIKQFGFDEVYTSTEIAFDTYYWKKEEGAEYAFGKIGGICYNRKYRAQEEEE